MKAIPLRLLPGQDLKKSCFSFFRSQVEIYEAHVGVQDSYLAGALISCVGSLSVAQLRLAGASSIQKYSGPLEILSLSGTLSVDGVHLHISVADSAGQVIGGHLMDGCLIHTTAELVILLLPDYEFKREQDSSTGYKELKIARNELERK